MQALYSLIVDIHPFQPKYEAGMKYFSLLKQPAVVTPHWFDDSFKCARPQPLERYLFPEPLVFKPELSTATSSAMNNPQHRQSDDVIEKLKKVLNNEIKAPRLIDDKEKQEDRHAVWASVAAASAHEQDTISKSHIPSSQGEEEGVWADRRILLSESLELASGRRESVNAQIVTRNGVVVDKIEATVTDYDILITTYCEGPEFRAVRYLSYCGSLQKLWESGVDLRINRQLALERLSALSLGCSM